MKRLINKIAVSVLVALLVNVLGAPGLFAQPHDLARRDLSDLPSYKPEYKVQGGFRIFGSELKGAMEALANGFKKYQPDAKISTNFITSTEGALAGLYIG